MHVLLTVDDAVTSRRALSGRERQRSPADGSLIRLPRHVRRRAGAGCYTNPLAGGARPAAQPASGRRSEAPQDARGRRAALVRTRRVIRLAADLAYMAAMTKAPPSDPWDRPY